jgi:hypothetical protein
MEEQMRYKFIDGPLKGKIQEAVEGKETIIHQEKTRITEYYRCGGHASMTYMKCGPSGRLFQMGTVEPVSPYPYTAAVTSDAASTTYRCTVA